jgi:Na+/proline symporter
MSLTDWIVLGVTLLTIVIYGVWKSGSNKNIDQFLMGGRSMRWYHVGLSVMATQASAITFLSAPGQAYSDGMRFVQFYLGLPLAMIVLCITFVPIFHRLKVYTAYEFLEQRFDLKTPCAHLLFVPCAARPFNRNYYLRAVHHLVHYS